VTAEPSARVSVVRASATAAGSGGHAQGRSSYPSPGCGMALGGAENDGMLPGWSLPRPSGYVQIDEVHAAWPWQGAAHCHELRDALAAHREMTYEPSQPLFSTFMALCEARAMAAVVWAPCCRRGNLPCLTSRVGPHRIS
jgi:hypothetical protein